MRGAFASHPVARLRSRAPPTLAGRVLAGEPMQRRWRGRGNTALAGLVANSADASGFCASNTRCPNATAAAGWRGRAVREGAR